MSGVLSFPQAKFLGPVDVIPKESYLQVKFETQIPSGSEAEVSIEANENTYFDIKQMELDNDDEAYGEVRVVVNGEEITLLSDTNTGKTYYIDVENTVGQILATKIILKAYTSTTTSKVNYVTLYYSGRVVSFLREE